MKKIFLLSFLIIAFINSNSQELNCQIQIASQQVQTTDRRVFQTLQTAVYEFMNQTKWTNYTYKVQERIECSILINISYWNLTDQFRGTIQVQSRRPIYHSSYDSPLLNYIDKDFEFTYLESEPLDFQINSFTSNLTSVLAFYAYMIIGLDFDSYALNGGNPYFGSAQTIVNNAQNTKEPGWKAFESLKNRYWFVENLLNSSYGSVRESIYKYHRHGLDVMADDLEKGRSSISESLELLKKVKRDKPNLWILRLIFDTKCDEFVNIYSGASAMDKPKAVNILKEIDPTHSDKYDKILQSK